MASTLPFSLPSSTWTWIALLYIIDAFHLDLPCPYSYHHIPYALCVEVQRALRIPLIRLVINPFIITTWHAFLVFHYWCLSFSPWGVEKGHQGAFICVSTWQGTNRHYKRSSQLEHKC
jgi:hypothetical protein